LEQAMDLLVDIDQTVLGEQLREDVVVENAQSAPAADDAAGMAERIVGAVTGGDRDAAAGASTRIISRVEAIGSGMRYNAPKQQTASKAPSAKGSRRASPRRYPTRGPPLSVTARASIGSE
jgi:hypothetical protein